MAVTTVDPTPVPAKSPASEPSGVWSIERVVALGTPLFTAAAGYCFTLLGKAVPGVNLNKGQFTALFISGAVAALTAALTWLHGRQKFVNFIQGAEHVTGAVDRAVQANVPQVHQIQAMLEAHEAAVVDAVSQKIGIPPSAEDVAKQIVGQLWPQPTVGTVQPTPPAGP